MSRHSAEHPPAHRAGPTLGDAPIAGSGGAARGPRPSPKPIDIVLDAPRRKRVPIVVPLHRRWARRLTRAARSRRGRWFLVALACLAVLLVGLLANGFLSTPAPSAGPAPSITPGSVDTGSAPTPGTPTHSSAAASSRAGAAGDQAVLQTLRSRFPDNPLNHLHGAGVHEVVIEATSSESVPIVGWLVPTGLSNTYGTQRNADGHWTLRQQALGKGYLAAVFIQAGRDGAPVTCRVIVDGKVTNTETTSGGYGRTVCLG